MKRLWFVFVSFCLVAVSIFAPFAAVTAEGDSALQLPPAEAALVISEVYANPDDTSQLKKEFVELYNRSDQPIDLTGYSLERKEPVSTSPQQLTGIVAAHGYLAFEPKFSLLNSSSTLMLHYPAGLTPSVVSFTYSTTTKGHSWELQASSWQDTAQPTPNAAPATEPEEPEPPEEPEVPPVPPCSITDVYISEILANPAGSDAAGGEFIELYNDGSETVSLVGCTLATDKLSSFDFHDVDHVAAKSYKTFWLQDKLLNSNGTVRFETATYEDEVHYPLAADDMAWALIDDAWQFTNIPTPNAANQPAAGLGSNEDETSEEVLAACPAGKYRNPETGRCKTIETLAVAPLPCEPGKQRNIETGRCRSIVTASLTPCAPGEERNVTTNRCRKVQAASELAPCQAGYERNPETNRCRKVASVLAASNMHNTTDKKPTYDWLILIVAGTAIGSFLLYEYRRPIGQSIRRLLKHRQAN